MYRGNLIAVNILEAICASVEKPKGQCLKFMEDGSTENIKEAAEDSGVSIYVILLFTLFGLVVVFAVLGFLYKRFIKREIS